MKSAIKCIRTTNVRIVSLIAILGLIIQPLSGVFISSAAAYSPGETVSNGPFTLSTSCQQDKVVMDLVVKQEVARWVSGKVAYQTAYGSDMHNLSSGDVDMIHISTGKLSIPAGTAQASIYGLYLFGVYSKEFTVNYNEVRCDTIPPTITMKSSPATIGSGPFQKVGFEINDQYDVARVKVNEIELSIQPGQAVSIDGISVGQKGGQRGNNTITAWDIEGNQSGPRDFVLDDTNPIVQSIDYSNDRKPTKDQVIVTITANEPVIVAGWEAESGMNDTVWFKKFSENTSGTVTLVDRANNETVHSYDVVGIDTVGPTITINPIYTLLGTKQYIISGTTTESTDKITVTVTNSSGVDTPIVGSALLTGTVWQFITPELADGQYSVVVTGEDMLGNPSDAPVYGETLRALEPFIPAEPLFPSSKPIDPRGVVVPQRSTSSAVRDFTVAAVNLASQGQDDNTAVLGTKTTKEATKAPAAAIEPSEEGWRLFGLAWYWWVLIIAALAGAGWYAREWHRGRAEA